MLHPMGMRVMALAAVVLMMVAAVHTAADFDPCLWYGTAPGAGHSSHACQICSLGGWAVAPSSPEVAPSRSATTLDLPGSRQWGAPDREEASAPRAPPVFPA